ncbi:MAG: NAD(P)-dependent oxidoreductase [Opitutales bacterium]|nr:NAD(P)-dependent oxidoreductase [Opitutales bacterium]
MEGSGVVSVEPGQARIGLVGTGVMGRHMAGHILSAGYALHVHTRSRDKAVAVLEAGAVWADTPEDLAQACEVILTIVGYPADVEKVYFGEKGLLGALRPGTVLVDMTTSSPELAQRIAASAGARGGHALDAPVSGGDRGAREATLSIMVGGADAAFRRVKPILEVLGKTIVHHGPSGAGQHCKMSNQIAVAASTVGVCEALAYAQSAGLDAQALLRSISTGAAGSWTLSNLAPRILEGDFSPGFYVKHMVKDLRLAVDAAQAVGVTVPSLEVHLRLFEELASAGFPDAGTHALFKSYDKSGGQLK